MTPSESIAENIRTIRANITAALHGEDRSVYLVAATKMNDADRVRAAIAAGVDACGENKVQEFLEKDALGAYDGCPKHFIGRLQSNKVNKVVGRVDLIQSVDSEALLTRIDRRAAELGCVQDILIEISVAGEAQKSGIPPEALPALLACASRCGHIRVRGLMCVPPVLVVDNRCKKYDNIFMDFLSMGMTDDYLDAVAAGANMVRIGSAIFGRRQY